MNSRVEAEAGAPDADAPGDEQRLDSSQMTQPEMEFRG